MTLPLQLLSVEPHGGGARLTLAGRAEVLDVVPGQVQVRAWGRVPGQPSVLDVQTLWGRQPVRVPAAQLAAVCEALGISPRFPCPACEGEGVTDTPAPGVPPRCPACTGRGTVTPAQLARYQAQVLSEQSKRPPPCPRCDGEGQVWAVPYDTPRECPECEGRGVELPAPGVSGER